MANKLSIEEIMAATSDVSDAQILSLAYDLNAMPEQMNDKKLLRLARVLLWMGINKHQTEQTP